jgi:hypothetical protein
MKIFKNISKKKKQKKTSHIEIKVKKVYKLYRYAELNRLFKF